IGALDDINNLWYFHLEDITGSEALAKPIFAKRLNGYFGSLVFLNISFIGIMAELRDQVSQYIDFEPNKIHFPITEDDRWLFRKIIADQEGMRDI
ncbi:22583_t:CDS:2, partial [Rhizophagus irregularis]